MIRRSALVSAAAAALVLVPTAAFAYDAEGYTSSTTDPTPAVGQPVVLTVDGDPAIAGKTVTLTVRSSPASIPDSAIQIAGVKSAGKVADANGVVAFTVSLDQPGTYTAAATVDGQLVSDFNLAVAGSATSGGALAATGFDGAGLATGAGALVVAGAGAVLVAKRRQAARV